MFSITLLALDAYSIASSLELPISHFRLYVYLIPVSFLYDLISLLIMGDFYSTLKVGSQGDQEVGVRGFVGVTQYFLIFFKIPLFLIEIKVLADYDRIWLEKENEIFQNLIDFEVPR